MEVAVVYRKKMFSINDSCEFLGSLLFHNLQSRLAFFNFLQFFSQNTPGLVHRNTQCPFHYLIVYFKQTASSIQLNL